MAAARRARLADPGLSAAAAAWAAAKAAWRLADAPNYQNHWPKVAADLAALAWDRRHENGRVPFRLSSLYLRRVQLRSSKTGTDEVGVRQIGLCQIRSREIRPRQDRALNGGAG